MWLGAQMAPSILRKRDSSGSIFDTQIQMGELKILEKKLFNLDFKFIMVKTFIFK